MNEDEMTLHTHRLLRFFFAGNTKMEREFLITGEATDPPEVEELVGYIDSMEDDELLTLVETADRAFREYKLAEIAKGME